MSQLIKKIEELEKEKRRELRRNIIIYGTEAKVLTARNMAKLHRLAYPHFKIPNLPLIAEARIDSQNDLEKFLWKYGWLVSSALSRIQYKGKDLGVFTHINPFDSEEYLIDLYQKSLGMGAVKLDNDAVQKIMDRVDGRNVIVTPFENIQNSPRGMISLKYIISGRRHPVALGAFGNNKYLLDSYIEKYINVLKKGPFTPSEMGVWFSEEAGINTLRPFELGDCGIGIYNRNLTNKEYRALALRR